MIVTALYIPFNLCMAFRCCGRYFRSNSNKKWADVVGDLFCAHTRQPHLTTVLVGTLVFSIGFGNVLGGQRIVEFGDEYIVPWIMVVMPWKSMHGFGWKLFCKYFYVAAVICLLMMWFGLTLVGNSVLHARWWLFMPLSASVCVFGFCIKGMLMQPHPYPYVAEAGILIFVFCFTGLLCIEAILTDFTFRDQVQMESERYTREMLKGKRSPPQGNADDSGSDVDATDVTPSFAHQIRAAQTRASTSMTGAREEHDDGEEFDADRATRSDGSERTPAEVLVLDQTCRPEPPWFVPPTVVVGTVAAASWFGQRIAVLIGSTLVRRQVLHTLLKEADSKLDGARPAMLRRILTEDPLSILMLTFQKLPMPDGLETLWRPIADAYVKAFLTNSVMQGSVDGILQNFSFWIKQSINVATVMALLTVILSLVLCLYLSFFILTGFKREYVRYARGEGLADKEEVRPWKATMMPGILISMCVMSFYFSCFLVYVFGGLSVMLFISIRFGALSQIPAMLLTIGLPILLLWLLRDVLSEAVLEDTSEFEKGHAVLDTPVEFSILYAVNSGFNRLSGVLLMPIRVIKVWVWTTAQIIFRVDKPGLPGKLAAKNDPVYISFAAVVQLTARQYHPVYRTACRVICPMIGEEYVIRHGNGTIDSEISAYLADPQAWRQAQNVDENHQRNRQRRLRIRNRFWLYATLARNPSLQTMRKNARKPVRIDDTKEDESLKTAYISD
jgi:hypothetical protein